MYNPFSHKPKQEVNNSYTLLDGEGKVLSEGMSLLEFCVSIEGKTLEETEEYTLLPMEGAPPNENS